jgi:hypothetical protein
MSGARFSKHRTLEQQHLSKVVRTAFAYLCVLPQMALSELLRADAVAPAGEKRPTTAFVPT